MTAEMIYIIAALCAAVLGVQLTVIVLVWVMNLMDRIAAHKRREGE